MWSSVGLVSFTDLATAIHAQLVYWVISKSRQIDSFVSGLVLTVPALFLVRVSYFTHTHIFMEHFHVDFSSLFFFYVLVLSDVTAVL